MKKIYFILATALFSLANAQNISDYKYIYVPEKFKDFKSANLYNLNSLLTTKLAAKNYTVLRSESELSNVDRCDVLDAEVADKSNLIRTRIELVFRDCAKKEIATFAATSNQKEYAKGFQESLSMAANSVKFSAPAEKPTPVITQRTENFTDGNGDVFEKTAFTTGGFALVNTQKQKTFNFIPTSKKGIYLVNFAGTDQSGVAFEENGILTVDSPLDRSRNAVFTLKR